MILFIKKKWQSFKKYIDDYIHFLQLHYLYIACIIFIFSGLYYCSPGTSWAYIDALYMAATGCTNTGTNTIPLSAMTPYQVSVLYFSSLFGSHIIISFVIVMVRKHYFSKRFQEVLLFNKARKQREIRKRQNTTNNSNHRPKITISTATGVNKYSLDNNNFIHYNNSSNNNNTNNSQFHSNNLIVKESGQLSNPSSIHTTIPMPTKPNEEDNKDAQASLAITQSFPKTAKDVIDSYRQRQEKSLEAEEEEKKNQHSSPSPSPSFSSSSPSLSNDDDADNISDKSNKQKQQLTINTSNGLMNSIVSSPVSPTGNNNIIFADNVSEQRENARQRFEAKRKLEELKRNEILLSPSHLNLSNSNISNNDINDMMDHTNDYDATDILSLALDQVELTKEQRYQIGGAEYRALDLLTYVIPIYYFGLILGSAFAFRIYIAVSPYAQQVLATSNGSDSPVNPWHMSLFVTLSAFDNLGLTHLDANLVPFQNAPFPLLLLGFLILAGNTAYPIFLRFTLWVMYRLTPRSYVMHRETLRYLLDHPRRCYTTLFPSRQTWWLFAIVLAITLTELVVFVVTNYWLPVTDGLPISSQILDGLFQGIATRNAGFAVVNLTQLNPGTIIVYIVAMYIGVYPVAISMRNSNVYQERSLGMYRTGEDENDDDDDGYNGGGGIILKLKRQRTINSIVTVSKTVFKRPDFFVITQIQRQITKDICWVIVGIFLVCVLEAQAILSPKDITVVTVIYECISAFGNVGSSMSNYSTSQSAQYRTLSKLIIIILMYRGRHRALPAAIDRAVLLPSEQLNRSETQNQQLQRLHRHSTNFNNIGFDYINNNNRHNIRVYKRCDTF